MTRHSTSSTTDAGNAFRDAVASLLRTKYADVQTEVLVGHKKVDVVYRYVEYGRTITVGVECKNYAAPLTKDQIRSEIWADYSSLVEERKLHMVIVVAPKDINAMARAYVDGIPSLRFQTYEQFEDSLIGLNDYVVSLAGMFAASELESYYVEARFEGHNASALAVTADWLQSSDPRPLAVLGGYGKGKTSLALRVVSQQAARHLADPAERIPILIRLGQVVHETQLEALFGKEFTARHAATDFRFSTLMHLNAQGRLLVVLDGFDEMKHAMSVADFRATFREFNRLLGPKAKVMLLGRPNALPTEARTHVFRGQRRFGAQTVADPQFASWREEEIAFFDADEIERFLHAYLAHLLKYQQAVDGMPTADFVERRVREVIARVSEDLLRRPVQARIVAELASDPSFRLDGFTSYTLYEQFIKRLIERDTEEKRARGVIALGPRYAFQQELAWWSWTKDTDGQGHFNRDEIPLGLVDRLPDGNAADGPAKLSEYIVSSLTEEKEAGVLYFAHRSFQEFLVADRLRTAQLSPEQHVVMSAAITPDIRSFLDAAPDQFHLGRWFETLAACEGPLELDYLRYFQSSAVLVKDIAASARGANCSPAHIAVVGLPHEERTDWPLSRTDTINLLANGVVQFEQVTSALAALCLLRMGHAGDRAAIRAFVAALFVRVAQRVRDPGDLDKALTVPAHRFGVLEELLGGYVRRSRNLRDGIVVQLDLGRACRLLYGYVTQSYIRPAADPAIAQLLSPFVEPIEPTLKFEAGWEMPGRQINEAVKPKERRELVESILRVHGERFNVVSVNDRQRRALAGRGWDDHPFAWADGQE
ncbi:NACHT domain-containing protein [Burkholderia stagnalis]|uniref:NACHT domain-containing protein n=1 Tax=Burkholderia stagnalis TaxID=1503054 RepID=UPI000F59CC35|nr:NACHT domain-containing protein [Burkholderia stagnalis]RQQ13289.1 NACHT domain-containing protein [Burkholderia stagnalis]RQR03970.1 NACHT domain-containing protein [Burkholderia stagnalis]RQX93776.1 NACHT domain-containing protein [Burkholderia stagnalis]RQY83012.1 NACHT domain-containing protein [Burkholderia stagnalis]